MEKTVEATKRVCDVCGRERPLARCDFCGAEVCRYCSARVFYTQTEDVRGHVIGFYYDKIMCQKHLPEVSKK